MTTGGPSALSKATDAKPQLTKINFIISKLIYTRQYSIYILTSTFLIPGCSKKNSGKINPSRKGAGIDSLFFNCIINHNGGINFH
jgi:hypothetical protein